MDTTENIEKAEHFSHPGHKLATRTYEEEEEEGSCVNSAPCVINKARRDHQFERIHVSASYKSMSYTCEACGLDSDHVPGSDYVSDVPYTCKLCNIFVHEECLKLPPTVRIRCHPRHTISHTYWLGEKEEGLESDKGSVEEEEEEEEEEEDEDEDEDEEQIDKRSCGVCDAKMNFDHGGYRCEDCGFVCHSKCIGMFVINDDEESKEEWEKDPSEKPSFVVIRESLVEEGQEKKMVIEEMTHFSHHHNLVLLQDINEHSRAGTNIIRCECCSFPVPISFSSLPSCYGCPVPECDYYMHTSCATLPRQIRLLNETPATLIQLHRISQCDICDEYCNGFAYFYRMTQEVYCVHCSRLSLLDSVKHRCHRHARGKRSRIFLAGASTKGGSFHCHACGQQHGKNRMYFTCVSCNFYLDMKCAALPIRVKPPDGKYEDHDLVLTSRPLPSDSYQSHCLVCEEVRNPARWFYYCSLCDFSAHVECVVGKYPKVKFGGSHMFEHPHPLTLDQFAERKHRPSCHECEINDYDVGFRCTNSECDYVMCFTCSQDQE